MRERMRRDLVDSARERVSRVARWLVEQGEHLLARAHDVARPAVSAFATTVASRVRAVRPMIGDIVVHARALTPGDLVRYTRAVSTAVAVHARRSLEVAGTRISLAMLLCACAVLVPGALLSGSSDGALSRGATVPHRVASSNAGKPAASTSPALPSGFSAPIQRENALPGTTDWIVPADRTASDEIQAYASAPSVSPGASLTFYVSVQQAGAQYQIDIYRLGWYGGTGGRLLLQTQQAGKAQGYWDETKGVLVGCGSCSVDRKTGLAEANWQPSYQLSIPHDWLTGVYLAKFTAQDGKATTITFDVRGDPHSTYVMVTTDTTVQAYSDWGGASLYLARYRLPNARGSMVSLDRPVAGWGTAQGLLYETDGIRWLEKNGYDVSYISSVDLDENPAQLLGHRAMLDFGHDEYWSKAMRDGVQAARDAGVGLGFIGANTDFWQIRFAPDSHGVADHTIICYKSATSDPYVKGDRSQLTVESRSSLVGHPENALLGAMYSDWISPPRAFPWRVSPDAPGWLLAGTGLQPGTSYGCGLVGYEWDKTYNNGYAPSDLKVLSDSTVTSIHGKRDSSNTVYYVAPSGALVFDAGSVKWDFALDGFRLAREDGCGAQQYPVPGMQQLLANVLAALIVRQKP